jgi:acyl carrier protein
MTSPQENAFPMGDGPEAGAGPQEGEPASRTVALRTPAEIEEWFVATLSRELQIPPERIDVSAPFETIGLDSVTAVGMTGSLEDWLGLPIDPMMIYDYPTIEALAKHLAERTRDGRRAS